MKLNFFALLMIAALPSAAFAHLEIGVWKGQTATGAECAFEVFEQSFVGGMHHPLAERVRVVVQGDEFMVGHPSIVDEKTGLVHFNHDRFEGVLPTPTGAHSLSIVMEHSQTFEGPRSFFWMSHEWKADVRKGIECLNLIHQN